MKIKRNIVISSWATALLFVLVWSAVGSPRPGVVELDAFVYPSAKAVAKAWRAQEKSPRPLLPGGSSRGVTFVCPFRKNLDRVYWDRALKADLSRFTSFEFDIYCDQPAALRGLAIYFKSGKGWYAWSKPLTKAGRQTIQLPKNEFSTEGKPDGWHRIERIRISPRKGKAINTSIVAHSLRARANSILIIQGTTSTGDEAERSYGRRTTRRVSRWLTELSIPHGILTDEEVSEETLSQATVAILPYNPNLPQAELKALEGFMKRGGKVMACYSSDAQLARLMHMKLGEYRAAKQPGQWASFSFVDDWAKRVPGRVYQESWNIRAVTPADHTARVIAQWEGMHGGHTTDPAWVESGQGLWMTHILLEDDLQNKQAMLLGMLCHFDPSLWRNAAAQLIQKAGQIDSFRTFEEAASSIRSQARKAGTSRQVNKLLKKAQGQFENMLDQYQVEDYPGVVRTGRTLRDSMIQAYARAQTPRQGEFRGVWDHDGVGWYPGHWNKSCSLLAKDGMTAILPNVAWGGLVHYDSKVLPTSDTFRQHGDQLAQCVTAAHRKGLEVHAWKVCWNLDGAPSSFVKRMQSEGRVQTTSNGNGTQWLCPTHPKNRQLEIAILKEMATQYDIDGIHLDYIRFPNSDSCYGTNCHSTFERWLGKPVPNWPKDVKSGGRYTTKFLRWRAEVINQFVSDARNQLKAVRPDLKFSAAVFGKYPECIEGVGQDWGLWLQRGWVDFVCPMNYTPDLWKFTGLTRDQLSLRGARGRIYPGIGVTSSESQLSPDLVVEQIVDLREQGADGFVLFKLDPTLRDQTLPILRLGPTRK